MIEKPEERGFVLLSAMLLALIVMMAAGAVMTRSSALARDTIGQRGQLRAHFAAEAGLAKARHALRMDSSWRGAEFELGRCTVRVVVEPRGENQFAIEARAVCHPRGPNGPRLQVTLAADFGAITRYRGSR